MRWKKMMRSAAALFLTAALLSSAALAADSRDVVSAALGEVGYTEGEDEYSKFGEWYGLPNSYWCDMFVSWCAMKGNVSTKKFPRHCSCTTHVKRFSNLGQYRYSAARGGTYIPQQGDVIFFYKYQDDPAGKTSNHTGLVLYVEDGYVYTIEGNALSNRLDYAPSEISDLRDGSLEPPDHVVVNRYPLNAPHIHGYGIPAYDSRTPVELEGFVDLGQYAESRDVFQYLCDAGLMSPTSAHTFSPEHGMTRGEFFKLTADFFGLPDGSLTAMPFDDVSADHGCYSAILSARAAGLTDGLNGNRFQPDIYISPDDARTVLNRALAYWGMEAAFPFSSGALSYMLTPYTVRADIAQAFYTLCQQFPLSEAFGGRVVFGEGECPARSLEGVVYVPLESLRQAVPGVELAETLRGPAWNTDRVRPDLASLRYDGTDFAVSGFLYRGAPYVDLNTVSLFLPLTVEQTEAEAVSEDGTAAVVCLRVSAAN